MTSDATENEGFPFQPGEGPREAVHDNLDAESASVDSEPEALDEEQWPSEPQPEQGEEPEAPESAETTAPDAEPEPAKPKRRTAKKTSTKQSE